MPKPKFYECGGCGHCHPFGFSGDCRDDKNRFTHAELDEKYGSGGWEEYEQCKYCGGDCNSGEPSVEMCDEAQAGGFNNA